MKPKSYLGKELCQVTVTMPLNEKHWQCICESSVYNNGILVVDTYKCFIIPYFVTKLNID